MLCPITNKQGCKCTQKEILRKLFTEHAVYTKFYIESSLQSLPDLDAITVRLLQNQIDIGNYVKPVIGEKNGDMLSSLLKDHILAAAGAVTAVKGGNKTAIDVAVKKVFDNGAQVAKFLSSLNPNKLPYNDMFKMFNMHLQYVLDMTTEHANKEYDKEYKTYDMYYNHMLGFSDTLNNALSVEYQIDYTMIVMIVIILIIIIAILYFFTKIIK